MRRMAQVDLNLRGLTCHLFACQRIRPCGRGTGTRQYGRRRRENFFQILTDGRGRYYLRAKNSVQSSGHKGLRGNV